MIAHSHLPTSALEPSISKSPLLKLDRTVQAPVRATSNNRPISYVTLGFIAYFAIAAGPFGIENAVKAAGSLPVLLAVVILPITWGLPQALMTAELSSMMNENGGYILWVRRGLGDYAGWINAYNSIASNLCDLPTYPVLFCGYIQAFLTVGYGYVLSSLEQWLIKCVTLLLVCGVNVMGMRVVGCASIVMSVFVLAPFLIEPIVIEKFKFQTWTSIAPQIDWSVFLSTILWNYQGWDSLGCVAGEVQSGGKTYPLAILIAIGLISINYAFPVAFGVMVEPDVSLWNEGSLETIGMRISPLIGLWVGAAAVVATFGEFNVVMACSSRAMWAAADCRMVPSILSKESKGYKTPIGAILFQSISTAILMCFTFDVLVVLDTFFNNVTLLLEFCAYLRLRYSEPNAERPFQVPFGLKGAWIITVPKVIVLFGVLVAQERQVWLLCGAFNVLISVMYLIWRSLREQEKSQALLELEAKSYET